MADSMEDAFSKVCDVFGIEKLNKHREDSIKYVVENEKDILSICRRSLGACRNIIAASKIRRRFVQVLCPLKFHSFLLLFVEFRQNSLSLLLHSTV